jgi:hypothetical protein
MRSSLRLVPRCLRWVIALLVLIGAGFPARADARLVGVVIDFQPHKPLAGKPLISIKRNGQLYPVREQELIYEGDLFVFDPAAGPRAYVKALIGAKKEITFDSEHVTPPVQGWPILQTLLPRLTDAYRWINSRTTAEASEPQNAIGRGDDTEADALSVLPNVHGGLVIADSEDKPLWIGWRGGTPPFRLSVAVPGKEAFVRMVCDGVAETACVRESLLEFGDQRAESLQVSIFSSDGGLWTETIHRQPVKWAGDLSDTSELGSLGTYLRATELLDRGNGEFVLESARQLASIAHEYPPARVLLDQIREGSVP